MEPSLEFLILIVQSELAQSSAMIEVFASVCRQQEMPRYTPVDLRQDSDRKTSFF